MKLSGIIVTVTLLVFSLQPVQGQQSCKIHILDAETGETIPFANVCFESLNKKIQDYTISDTNGEVIKQITTPSTIAVSYLGYKPGLDTIHPGESLKIYLHPTAFKMDDVVVTAQFNPVKADKSIYRVKVLNQQLIENKAANNLADLLAGELNMRTTQDGVLGTGLSMQGLSGEHVKILIDGVPVIGRQNGILDLSQLNLNNVDHVELVEGPMSVIYGSNALAGAINVITKDNRREKMSVNANSYYETVGVYNFDGAFSYRYKNHVFSLTGGRDFFGGYSVIDNSRADLWKPKLQYNADLDYSFKQKNTSIRLNSSYFNEELRDRGNLIPKRYELAIDQYFYTTRWNNRIDFSRSFKDKQVLNIISAYSIYDKTKKTTSNDLVHLQETLAGPDMQDTTKFDATVLRATFSSNPDKRINYQAGYDMNLETGSGKRIDGVQKIGDYAGFLNVRANISNSLSLQGGIRYIYNTRYDAPLVHSLNLKYSPFESFTIRASYGKGFRSPSLKELYLDFQDINHNISGNENLKAEYSNNYNLSFNYNMGFNKNIFDLEANIFHNKIRNKIDFLYDSKNATKAQYINITTGNYMTQGLEFKIKYNYHPRFSLQTGINLVGRSKLKDLKTFSYSTDYTANMQYKNLRYKFSLAVFYKYTGAMYNYRGYYTDNLELASIQEGYLSAYHTLDVTLSRPFLNDKVTISTGGKNLFDNKNIYSAGSGGSVHGGGGDSSTAVAWGRTFFTRLSFNLNKF